MLYETVQPVVLQMYKAQRGSSSVIITERVGRQRRAYRNFHSTLRQYKFYKYTLSFPWLLSDAGRW